MEAAIDDLFSRTDVETITAYISDGGNQPSRRVAAKLGFSVRGRGHGRSGEPMTVYTLPRDDWLRQRPSAPALLSTTVPKPMGPSSTWLSRRLLSFRGPRGVVQ